MSLHTYTLQYVHFIWKEYNSPTLRNYVAYFGALSAGLPVCSIYIAVVAWVETAAFGDLYHVCMLWCSVLKSWNFVISRNCQELSCAPWSATTIFIQLPVSSFFSFRKPPSGSFVLPVFLSLIPLPLSFFSSPSTLQSCLPLTDECGQRSCGCN